MKKIGLILVPSTLFVTVSVNAADTAGCAAAVWDTRIRTGQATSDEYTQFYSSLRILKGLAAGNLPGVEDYARARAFAGSCSDDERQMLLSLVETAGDSSDWSATTSAVALSQPGPTTVKTQKLDEPTGATSAYSATGSGAAPDSGEKKSDDKTGASVVDDDCNRQKLYNDCGWVSGIDLGYQLQPNYDDTGRSSGFDKQNLFGRFFVDGIVGPNDSTHLGLDLIFAQWPTVKEQTVEGDDPPATFQAPDSFNDVDDSVNASLYVFQELPFGYDSSPGDSGPRTSDEARLSSKYRYGPVFRTGISTREVLKSDGKDAEGNQLYDSDSLIWWAGMGMRFLYADFIVDGECLDGKCRRRNGFNRGELEIMPAYFEDYFGKDNELRALLNFRYRIFNDNPFYLSFVGNMGSGEDVVSVGLSYTFTPDVVFKGVQQSFGMTAEK